MREGKETNFPQALLRALCVMYSGFRVVSFKGTVSEAFETNGGILAGCSCATTLARVMVYRLLLRIQNEYAGLFLANVIDDVSATSVGTRRFVIRVVQGVTGQLVRGFAELELPLNGKKSVFVCSDPDLGSVLEDDFV